jgi:hypothetical protein
VALPRPRQHGRRAAHHRLAASPYLCLAL